MPRPTISIPPEIQQWIMDEYCYEHKTAEEIVQALANEHGIEMTARTLQRRLKEWDCKKQTRVEYTFELISRFLILFYQMVLDDSTIAFILGVEGMNISQSNVGRLRRKLGIRRRVRAGDYDIGWEELIAIVEREYHEGMLRNYGRNFLYAHFRRSQYLVSRYRLWEAVRIVDLEGIALRTGDVNRKRGSYEVPGPNWIWSLDGYCKLELVGIQIYAAIDAYSRMVLWIYVGISGRTAVSVKRQYLDVLHEGALVPKALRTDHGGETTMLADAHFRISESLRIDEEESLRFIDCFLYGTSTANQRIEAWWG